MIVIDVTLLVGGEGTATDRAAPILMSQKRCEFGICQPVNAKAPEFCSPNFADRIPIEFKRSYP